MVERDGCGWVTLVQLQQQHQAYMLVVFLVNMCGKRNFSRILAAIKSKDVWND